MCIEERTSDTTTLKDSIIGEGIAAYTLTEDYGECLTAHTKMAYAPSSEYRLMAPQWLGMKDKDQDMPKDKCIRF